MTIFPPLCNEQRKMAEDNLSVVGKVINSCIAVNETVYGFEYDDVYQEGCMWLCKAAATFDETKGVKFSTYAYRVVANGLKTYCRLMCGKQKHLLTMADSDINALNFDEEAQKDDYLRQQLYDEEVFTMLNTLKKQYKGTVRNGIEALELKCRGLTGADIARMYGVKPTLVGAWISRAVQKIKTNAVFNLYMEQLVEENAL